MKEKEQIIELAKMDGCRVCEDYPNVLEKYNGKTLIAEFNVLSERGFKYLTSRDAIWPLIQKLHRGDNEHEKFFDSLVSLIDTMGERDESWWWYLMIATPRQLAEALLRAKGKWRE